MEESSKTNQIFLDGYICKEPIYRKTPLGREIADLSFSLLVLRLFPVTPPAGHPLTDPYGYGGDSKRFYL